MSSRFADSFYFLALLNKGDEHHRRAVALSGQRTGLVVATAWVLTEVADALAAPRDRRGFLALLDVLRSDPETEIIPATDELFQAGVDLYARRPDKEWSLTDCISFVIMNERGLGEALTGDRHFEQAGFRAVLREPTC
jgi:hypothetical protein